MDELIDIVNLKGEPTGNSCMKSVAHQNGILHASVHIWFYTVDQQVLIQKRSSQKNIFPNLWDVSVAGHIASLEKPITSAIREIKEEIGLSVSEKEMTYLGTWKEKHNHQNGLTDNEIHHIYTAKLNIDICLLKPQKEEVSDLKLIPINSFEKQCTNISYFVPHHIDYYKYIVTQLKEIIRNEK